MRTPSLLRRLRPVAVLALAGALTLAACGSGTSSSSLPTRDASQSLAVILASGAKLTDAGSAHMVVHMDVKGDQSGTAVLDGSFDVAAKAGQFDVKANGDGMPSGGLSLGVRLVGDALYLDASDLGLAKLFAGANPNAKWLKIDLSAAGGGSSATGGLGAIGADPAEILELLQGVGNVQDKGTETVRGVDTTHYHVVIDPKAVVSSLPVDQQAQASQMLAQLSNQPIPADVWIDGDGMLRKMVLSLDAAGTGTGAGTGTLTLTVELFDFGQKVDVQAPAASETADLTSIFDSVLGGAGGLGGLLPGLEGLGGLGGVN